ncbi:MAG: MBL fold metallo-hydrolase [Chloroflexi bacterium]|jgi:hydroxyacylglutathione hydrolase|nr:MBL fold metallo-hydrolase [Chloroflexota bacterium]MBT3669321.1 MBL fold metallo-hydrolase [Chloroflexota bacterium]MBT4003480.1 MBL fold metallo-hydrolase [Chloroflexota bacterium]MBT4306028.1 MBL fold metallo-hydrolase [Chloroflexota bacterium]MBT4532672.1 MBL fold metallo-hydrolase [Chloroflexota bacterium]
MSLEIVTLTLGPVETNAYLIADSETNVAIVIDPAWDGEKILDAANQKGWRISNIWLTHAHFDHLGGAAAVADGSNPPPPVALHPEDYWLWREQGGARMFGMDIDPGPEPSIDLEDGQELFLGDYSFKVLYAPGHTPGHVMFYCETENVLFSGDVIFQNSIGRTDLPHGDTQTLLNSIRDQVLVLPDETKIFSGHGSQTLVGIEKIQNPFLS